MRRVYAKAVTALHAIEVEDTVVAVLEFASGAVGTFEATTAAWPGYSRRVAMSGTHGTVVIEQDRGRPGGICGSGPTAEAAEPGDAGRRRRRRPRRSSLTPARIVA